MANAWMKWGTKVYRNEHGVLQKASVGVQQPIEICASCAHLKLSHLAGCFAKGCRCKKYIVTIKR